MWFDSVLDLDKDCTQFLADQNLKRSGTQSEDGNMQLTSAKNATFTGRDGRNHVAGRRAWNRKRARNLVAIAAAVEALGALLIPRTNAATVTLNADDASGTTTSFNGAGNWSGGGAPSSANDYVDSAHILRTPTSAGSITSLLIT
jgi:hypothetical protein